jgi:hypothetical protein
MSLRGITVRAPLGVAAVIAVAALTSACGSGASGSASAARGGGGASQSAAAASAGASGPSAGAGAASSAGSSRSGGTGGAGGSSGTSGTGGSGNSVENGTALLQKLGSVKPAGYTVESSTNSSSGATLASPKNVDSLSQCSALRDQNASGLTADYEAAHAFTSVYSDSTHGNIDISLSSYQPGDAQKQFDEITTAFQNCPSYKTTNETGASVTMTTSLSNPPETVHGDQVVEIQQTASVSGWIKDDFLLVREGGTILAISQNAVGSTPSDLDSLALPYIAAVG